MTSGNSTPRALARWRTRIQPEAIATSGSGKRRDQRSVVAAGGASTMRPLSVSRAASAQGSTGPSGTPKLSI